MWPSKMVAYDDVTDNDEMMMIDVMALPLQLNSSALIESAWNSFVFFPGPGKFLRTKFGLEIFWNSVSEGLDKILEFQLFTIT